MSDTTATRPGPPHGLGSDIGPQHAMLRPGVRVVRRDDGHLQVGSDRASSLIVADTPEIQALLSSLRLGHAVRPTSRVTEDVWSALLARGQIVDADSFFHRLPRELRSQHGRAALFAQHPFDAPWRLAARRSARVAVDADHHREEVTQLLMAAGIATGTRQASVALVIVEGAVRRERLDLLVQSNTPHLLISESEGIVRVGPFVEPGTTACLRCIDAHQGEHDPRHLLIVAQQADVAAHSPVVEPFDESQRLLAIALGVVDLVAYIEGDRPISWSTTIDVGRADLPRTLWKRHPLCGCTWGDDLPIILA